MAQSYDSAAEIDWVKPHMRGQLPIHDFHIPRRLKTFMNTCGYIITVDTAFERIMRECAALTGARTETWINQDIIDVFCAAHRAGYAHSIEVWDKHSDDKTLIGGVYGLSVGAVFFAESMFSRRPNASKVALVHLAGILKRGGYHIFDVQFTNSHLEQFGVFETPHDEYDVLLEEALQRRARFNV